MLYSLLNSYTVVKILGPTLKHLFWIEVITYRNGITDRKLFS
jgi:hypothetical protein